MLDAKLNVILLLFDLSAAFDTVNHDILLAKLRNKYGFSGTVFAWFTSYLSNRRYIVKINQSLSRDVVLFSGVPQGLILGPVLFNLYSQQTELLAKSHDFNMPMRCSAILVLTEMYHLISLMIKFEALLET